jgi:hypothetical protein
LTTSQKAKPPAFCTAAGFDATSLQSNKGKLADSNESNKYKKVNPPAGGPRASGRWVNAALGGRGEQD